MRKLLTIKNLKIILGFLVILGGLGFIGVTPTAQAQSAEFQWALNIDHGIQVNAEEDGGEFLYNLQLYNQNDKIVSDQTNSSGNFSIENSDLIAGEVYDLNLSLLDEASGDIRATHFEPVAIPQLTIASQCNTTFQGEVIDITIDIVPGLDLLGLDNPEVTIVENGDPLNSVTGLPHTYESGQRNRTYSAEVTFSDTGLLLSTETIDTSIYNSYCKDDDDDEEDEDEEETNFGYEVEDRKVTVTALSPLNDDYSYAWDFDGGEVDDVGQSVTWPYDDADDIAEVRLVISQDDEIMGSTTKSFSVSTNYVDSDGDGTPDLEEEEDGGDSEEEDDEEEDDEAEFTGDEEGLVNCTNNCGWEEFIALINRLVTWLIGFATVVATLLFMYAGFLYLTAGGDESQTDQAKGILTNVAVGFGIILVAWLVVVSIVTLLTDKEWRDENQPLIPIDLSYEIDDDRLQL